MNKTILRISKANYFIRNFCYKPIKRIDISSLTSKKSLKAKFPNKKESSRTPEQPSISLSKQLQSKILATGPITVADYMKEVLTNPISGYYMNRDVFGESGDFITSPEIGQIFGELVAIWCFTEWQKVGSPSPFNIVELGPGRGTLSRDILRVFSHFRIGNQLSLHLVEISPHLSQIQAQGLCYKHQEINNSEDIANNNKDNLPSLCYRKGETISGVQVNWFRKLDDIPKGKFSIVIAHEFFDALPIHKLQRDTDGLWKEILIDIDNKDENKFRMVLSKSQTPFSKLYQTIHNDCNDKRDCLEYSLETEKIIEQLTNIFEYDGGFGLVIDYGHNGEKSDTFRAFKNHKLHDPLFEPGTADLTADVDFKLMKSISERNDRMITFGPVEQRLFLERMEAETRLKVLLENCLPENKEHIKSGYEMLTNPTKMGSRFKFFSIFPAVLKEHLKKFPVSGFN